MNALERIRAIRAPGYVVANGIFGKCNQLLVHGWRIQTRCVAELRFKEDIVTVTNQKQLWTPIKPISPNNSGHPRFETGWLNRIDYGIGVDPILELGGPETYSRSIFAVAFSGNIAQIGVLTGFASNPIVQPPQFKNASIHGICVGSVEHYTNLNNFLFKHKIAPIIDRRFTFDDSIAAYEHLTSAAHMGKIVIQM